MIERFTTIGETAPLVAALTEPDQPAERLPVALLLNAGLVHKVGPGRQTVRLARRLAQRGVRSVRFDRSGIGDSEPRTDHLPWLESSVAEAREVMDHLERETGSTRFVLVGLCSGAITGIHTAREDARVAGLALINTRGYEASAEWNQQVMNRGWARDYWKKSLFRPTSWWRALTGRIQYRRLGTVIARQLRERFGRSSEELQAQSDELAGMVTGLVERGTELLFVHSEGDHAKDFFDVILAKHMDALRASGRFESCTVERTDHTFTLLVAQERLIEAVDGWYGARDWSGGGRDARAE